MCSSLDFENFYLDGTSGSELALDWPSEWRAIEALSPEEIVAGSQPEASTPLESRVFEHLDVLQTLAFPVIEKENIALHDPFLDMSMTSIGDFWSLGEPASLGAGESEAPPTLVCPVIERPPGMIEKENIALHDPFLNMYMTSRDEPVFLDAEEGEAPPPRKKIRLEEGVGLDIESGVPLSFQMIQLRKNSRPPVSEHLVASQWHSTLNEGMDPKDSTQGRQKKVWWQCIQDASHKPWQASIANRCKSRKPSGCPSCASRRLYRAAKDGVSSKRRPTLNMHPIASQWHSTLNEGMDPKDYTQGSQKKVWWVCEKDSSHKPWQALIANRCRAIRPSGCPGCASTKHPLSFKLSPKPPLNTHPIASQWHLMLNGDLGPKKLTQGSGKKAWWKCEENLSHKPWEATIERRCREKKPTGCPSCADRGKKVARSGL